MNKPDCPLRLMRPLCWRSQRVLRPLSASPAHRLNATLLHNHSTQHNTWHHYHHHYKAYATHQSESKPPPPLGPNRQSILNEYRKLQRAEFRARNQSLLLYAVSIGVITLGLSYAAVPLYRVFCSATGYNGTPTTSTGKFAPDRINAPVGEKTITIRFNADKSDSLNWKFWPCQKSVTVKPGETVLAFYKARNLEDHDVLGVATYNVTPGQVAPYFAKVECFCFDEQRLLAGEEMDLPVFFFIDKDFVDDPLMKDIDDIVLSYTFLLSS